MTPPDPKAKSPEEAINYRNEQARHVRNFFQKPTDVSDVLTFIEAAFLAGHARARAEMLEVIVEADRLLRIYVPWNPNERTGADEWRQDLIGRGIAK